MRSPLKFLSALLLSSASVLAGFAGASDDTPSDDLWLDAFACHVLRHRILRRGLSMILVRAVLPILFLLACWVGFVHLVRYVIRRMKVT